jgi:hypothetical protein
MNRIRSLVSLIVVAIFQTTPSLIAQESLFQANVPFQFNVENKTLPAGEYRITRHREFLRIGSDSPGVYVVAMGGGEPSHDGHMALVFDRVDGAYYLRKLVTTSSDSSMELPASRTERKALANLQVASARPPETKTISVSIGGR